MRGEHHEFWLPLVEYLEKRPRNLDVLLAQRLITLAMETEIISIIWRVLNVVRERGIELGNELYSDVILFFAGLDCWEDVLAIVDQMHTNHINLSEARRTVTSKTIPEEWDLIGRACGFPERFLYTGAKIFTDWLSTVQPRSLKSVPQMEMVNTPLFFFFTQPSHSTPLFVSFVCFFGFPVYQTFNRLVETACDTKSEDTLLMLLLSTTTILEMTPSLVEKLINFKASCKFVAGWLLKHHSGRRANLEKKVYMQLLIKLAQFDAFQEVEAFYTTFKSEIEVTTVVLIILAKTQARGYRAEDPMILFHKVSTLGFSPDPSVVTGLFDSCYSEGNLNGACEIYRFTCEKKLALSLIQKVRALDVAHRLKHRDDAVALFKDLETPLESVEQACQLMDAYLALHDFQAFPKLFDYLLKQTTLPLTSALFERFAIAAFKGKIWDLGLMLIQQTRKRSVDVSLNVFKRLMLLFDEDPNYPFAMKFYELGHSRGLLGNFSRLANSSTLQIRDTTLIEANMMVIAFLEHLRPTVTEHAAVSIKAFPPGPPPHTYLFEDNLPPYYSMLASVAHPPLPPLEKRTPKSFGIEHIAEGITQHFKPPIAFSHSPTDPTVIRFDPQSLRHWLATFPVPFTGV